MNLKLKCFSMLMIYSLTACTSLPKGTLLGASVGFGVGSLMNADNQSQKNTNLAATAVLGAAIGYLLSDNKVTQDQKLKTGQLPKEFAPKLNRPEVRKVWVPDQISADEYISGHWKYLITNPAVWSKED